MCYGLSNGCLCDNHNNIYRPQRSCEGYVFTGVCLSTGGEYLTRYTPLGADTPPGQVHSPRTRSLPLGPGAPQSGTPPQDQVPPQTRYTPQTRYPPRPGAPPGTPPGPGTPPPPRRDTAIAADGKHPTGMHSCIKVVLVT